MLRMETENVDWAKEDAQDIDRELEAHPELAGDRDAAWRQLERKGLEIELREFGYTRITGPGGVLWAEPDARYSGQHRQDADGAESVKAELTLRITTMSAHKLERSGLKPSASSCALIAPRPT